MEVFSATPASADRDKRRVVREMGCRPRQCLAVSSTLTSWGTWLILQPIRI
jgi:hypothetical protein